jgi:hypothetical protein
MSLFQTILESIENPNHAGSQQGLNLAQLLPGVQGAEPRCSPSPQRSRNPSGCVKSTAANQRQAAFYKPCQNLSQTGCWPSEIESLFGQERFNGLIGEIGKRTGLDPQLILQFLPALIPVIMKLLDTGTHKTDPQAQNPVVNNFLGSSQNGGALLNEAFQLASQFLRR